MPHREPAKALTIAGSDSGGAAGLQADLRTFAALGVYGMSVLTVATAQNSVSVDAVYPLPTHFVKAQLDAVLNDYGTDAVKTGFIGRVDLIETIAHTLQIHCLQNVVVDPVLVNHRGQAMFGPEVVEAYLAYLLPLADLLTPNLYEAALLSNVALPKEVSLHWLEEVARKLHALGPRHVLIKGGRDGHRVVDILYDGITMSHRSSLWLKTTNTHGSGDTLSAAACACLAQGLGMAEAVARAQYFTAAAIQRGAHWQLGQGHGPVAQWQT